MRIALAVIGLLALLMGLHWLSEGTGVLAYPHSPVMYLKPAWTYAGLFTALIGVGLIWSSHLLCTAKRGAGTSRDFV